MCKLLRTLVIIVFSVERIFCFYAQRGGFPIIPTTPKLNIAPFETHICKSLVMIDKKKLLYSTVVGAFPMALIGFYYPYVYDMVENISGINGTQPGWDAFILRAVSCLVICAFIHIFFSLSIRVPIVAYNKDIINPKDRTEILALAIIIVSFIIFGFIGCCYWGVQP